MSNLEKIDIHGAEKSYETAFKKLEQDISKENYILIKNYLEASAIGRTARPNARKKMVSYRARLKNLYLLKSIAKFFDKPLNKIDVKDMEKFILSLSENKFKKVNKENYSEKTKSNMKVCFISFLRYTLKDENKLSELTDWIETICKEKEISALSEEEIRKLISNSPTLKHKTLVALLFASGCRIEEFLNIRLEDIELIKDKVPYYRITVRTEFSKTTGRTFGIFWQLANELLLEYLTTLDKKDKTKPLFPMTYDAVRVFLTRIGKRVLDKRVNPHLFRHSGATHDANKGMDYFQLCKKYGWAISSKMPQRYIDRSGINERKEVEKFKADTFERVKKDLENQKEKSLILEKQMQEMKSLKNIMIGFIKGKIVYDTDDQTFYEDERPIKSSMRVRGLN